MRLTKISLTQIIKETLDEGAPPPSDTSPEEIKGNKILSSMENLPQLASQADRIMAQPDLTHFLRTLMNTYFSHVETNVKHRSMLELAGELRRSTN